MIRRRHGYLKLFKGDPPESAAKLERDSYAVLREVLSSGEVAALKAEISGIFETSPADREADSLGQFRHGMLNRSPLAHKAVGHARILEAIEPLLGEDCHIIANTAWRNVRGHQGGTWHIDAGPHVPRPEGVPWPDEIPYPIFAIGMHLYLEDCPREAGPTAVIPGSHRSGRTPPIDRLDDLELAYEGRAPVFLTAKAGDVALFVSDAWHRGTPAQPGHGRFFLQAHYGRRDIAQRVRTTAEVNHLSPDAIERAVTDRQKTLAGLHPIGFYDA